MDICLDVFLEILTYLIDDKNYCDLLTLSKEIYNNFKNRYYIYLFDISKKRLRLKRTIVKRDIHICHLIYYDGDFNLVASAYTNIECHCKYKCKVKDSDYKNSYFSRFENKPCLVDINLLYQQTNKGIQFVGVDTHHWIDSEGGGGIMVDDYGQFNIINMFPSRDYPIDFEKFIKNYYNIIYDLRVQITRLIREKWSNIIWEKEMLVILIRYGH